MVFLKNYVNTFPIEYGEPNRYCRLVISNETALKDCMERQLNVLEKCKEGKPFYGVCRGGLGMLTVPIIGDEKPLGFIEAGKFKEEESKAQSHIDRMSEMYGFSKSALDVSYHTTTYEKPDDLTALEVKLTTIASILTMLSTMMKEYEIQTQISDKEVLCRHIEKYIELNYMSDINMKVLSSFFKCSPSTITHTFNKYNGSNLKAYTSRVRVKVAKNLLAESNAPINAICKKVGIKDANYFCKVFRNVTGMSPGEYQKSVRSKK